MSTTKTAIPPSAFLTSQMYSLNTRRLSPIIGTLIPSATLGPVAEVPSPQLPRLYELTLSDESKLLLSTAPSLSVRLLRQEIALLKDEAMILQFIGVYFQEKEGKKPPEQRTKIPAPLSTLTPKLLKHSSDPRDLALPYSIFQSVAGTPLSTLTLEPSPGERQVVAKQCGSMARALAAATSPSGRFGTVGRVLPDLFSPNVQTSPERMGTKTWSEAFHSLLEGILRDGEDLAVLLPYEVIRAHYQRLSWRLDEVIVPRLLVLDAGSETNVMAERAVGGNEEHIRLTGLRCWNKGIFGDPLICDGFEDPSEGFMEGWKEGGDDIIEDADNAYVRMLLYRCYRAVVGIVTEYYRPRLDSSKRELESRRNLTSALKELEIMDLEVNDALKRARSMSNAVNVAKRQRLV